ncbi:MAG: hypothetical protein Q8O64_03875 [Sideroxyarcus sp.]|nr:hypothetical protein [Sideroxyarcus sp.]
MSIFLDKFQRRILPRWRTSGSAAQSADLMVTNPLRFNVTDDGSHLRESLYAFKREPSIGNAADLIAAASMAGEIGTAEQAAKFVLENASHAPQTLLTLAHSLLDARVVSNGVPLVGTRSNGSVIAHTRALLRLNPKNPVLWSDMARHYASHGNRREAKRCMNVALQLAPNHRWMLRIATRFLVHSGEEEAAHRLLAQHPRTPKDPWLIAAELAAAQVAQRPPKFWRQGNDLIKLGGIAPLHLSELATAVGMFELEAGEAKRARRLVEKALRDPTENTLAQVSWARESKHLKGASILDDLVRQASNAFEADFRLKILAGDLLGAKSAGEQWACDEPFAARPISGLAFIASISDDYDQTIELAERVRRLDGRVDSTLEMNTLFARMSSGHLSMEQDRREIEAIHTRLMAIAENREEKNAFHAMANLALWHYRFGQDTVGAELYQKAISMLEKTGKLESAALAAVYAAREAILVRQPGAQGLLEQAKALARRSRYAAAEFYVRKLEHLILSPDKSGEILSPTTAMRYLPVSKPRPTTVRLLRGPDGPVLLVPQRTARVVR